MGGFQSKDENFKLSPCVTGSQRKHMDKWHKNTSYETSNKVLNSVKIT